MKVCEWEKMSKDEFLIHMFAESSEQTMSKLDMEISNYIKLFCVCLSVLAKNLT